MLRLALAAALLATPTLADEVWTSEMGDIVYQSERSNAAILSFTNLDAYEGTLVIPGLAGNFSNRGVHEGYWLGTGAGDCPAFMSMPGSDEATTNWGRATIIFDEAAFPTSFTLMLGWCFEDPRVPMRAITNAG